MKRLLLLLVPIALAVGFWLYFSQPGSRETPSEMQADGDRTPLEPDQNAPSELVSGDLPTDTGVRQELSASSEYASTVEADAAGDKLQLGADERWLEGRVVWPNTYEPSAPIWVYLVSGPVRRSNLDAVVLASQGHTEQPFQSTILPKSPWEEENKARVVHQVTTRPDGSFRIPISTWRPNQQLQVLGDHLYRSRPLPLSNPATSEPLVLDTELGAMLRGQCVPPSGPGGMAEASKDLAGFVRIHEPLALDQVLNPASQKESGQFYAPIGSEGSFVLRGLPPTEAVTLQMLPEAWAQTLEDIGALQAGSTQDVSIQLSNGRAMEGKVLGPDQQPIAGAEVLIHVDEGPLSSMKREAKRVRTDERGRFSASALPLGPLLVQAHHRAYLSGSLLRLSAEAATTNLVLQLQAGKKLQGQTQFADGSPAPNIQIEAKVNPAKLKGMEGMTYVRNVSSAPAAQSDAEGRFVLTGLAELPYDLFANGEQAGNRVHGRSDGQRPGATDVILVMYENPVLEGRFVDPDGTAIPEYTLLLRHANQGEFITLYESQRLERIRQAEGAFRLTNLDPGVWQIQAHSDRMVLAPPIDVTIPIAADAKDLVLQGSPAGWVDGLVLGPDGLPFHGATVRLESSGLALTAQLERGPLDARATSLEDGSFHLGPLPHALHSLVASAPDTCPSEVVQIDLSEGSLRGPLVLNLRLGGTLLGEVLDDQGNPSVGRMISVNQTNSPGNNQTGQSDGQGRFQFEHLAPGDYQVVAMNGVREMAAALEAEAIDMTSFIGGIETQTAQIVEGEITRVQLGSPPAQPIRIHGTVTIGEEPVPSGFLSFSANGKPIMDDLAITNLDAGGHYSTVVDGAGRYRITVQRIGGNMFEQSTSEFVRDVPAVEELELNLALPEGRISGVVLDASGKPAASVRLSVFAQGATSTDTMMGGSYVETQTGLDGTFDVRGMLEGSYFVSAGGAIPFGAAGPSGSDSAPGRVSSETIALKEGEWVRDLRLKLAKPGTLRVTLIDDNQQSVAGASVFVRDAKGRALEAFSLITSDANGQCEYGGLAPGEYTVSARTEQLASQESGILKIQSGETTSCSLTLETGTVLHLSFRDTEGKPQAAAVQVLGPEGQDMARLFGMQDMQRLYSKDAYEESERRIGPLAPGLYRIRATILGETVEKSVRLRGEDTKRLTLRVH